MSRRMDRAKGGIQKTGAGVLFVLIVLVLLSQLIGYKID